MLTQQSAAQPLEIARQAAGAATTAATTAASTAASTAAETARNVAQNIDVDEIRDTIGNEVSSDVELVIQETRERPGRSLLLALGLGFLLGMLFGRVSKRRKASQHPEPTSSVSTSQPSSRATGGSVQERASVGV
jgi:hypothetical protein